MKRVWGNYWLDLIEFERLIKSHIERVIGVFVGKRYSGVVRLRILIAEAIKDCLDEIAQQERLIALNVDYELLLDYKDDLFKGFTISHVHCI
jgi:hypothetical protein